MQKPYTAKNNLTRISIRIILLQITLSKKSHLLQYKIITTTRLDLIII